MILVDIPTGNDDGQRTPHYILHCRHWEHCCPDGKTPDATHSLTGLHWNYTRSARGKEAVQNDMPRLWVWGCKQLLKSFPNDKPTVPLCVYGRIVSREWVHRWQMLFFLSLCKSSHLADPLTSKDSEDDTCDCLSSAMWVSENISASHFSLLFNFHSLTPTHSFLAFFPPELSVVKLSQMLSLI